MQITPETRVGKLLDEHPELEETLLDMSPAFSKLKNPVLRKTVAKVATLRQVSQVGNVDLGKLINTLRAAIGQDVEYTAEEALSEKSTSPPDWYRELKVKEVYDARDDIEKGEQPIGKALSRIRNLDNDGIFELITPFPPAPLIDKSKEMGYTYYTEERGPEEYHTFFTKKQE